MTKMSEPCDICGGTAMHPFLDVSLIGTRVSRIERCERCGFRQVRPRLSASEIKTLYPSDYFDAGSIVGYADYAREFQRRQREAYFLRRWLRRIRPDGRLLEVGCALGFLLAGLKGAGWRLEGIDAASFAAFYARTRYDLHVMCATLEEARFPDQSFDVIIQKDLLEHVAHPRRHLVETFRVLRPGGWVWLVTPNGEANLRPLVAAARDTTDREHRLPVLDQGHLSFFNRRHLTTLFTECGFRCHRMRMVGIRRGLRALGRLPGQRRFVRWLGPQSQDASPTPTPHRSETDIRGIHDRLAEQIDQDIATRHQSFRSWRPYYHYHRVMKRLDTLPASCEVGYDFDCLLQKTV